MRRLLFILLMLIVSVAGCVAQEKGIFIVDAMTFDTTSARRSRVLIEVSPTKNTVDYQFGTAQVKTFYLERVIKVEGRDATIRGGSTGNETIKLYYTDGLLVGGVVIKTVFVVRTGRYREIKTEFTRQQITSN